MATINLTRPDIFVPGVTVGAYPVGAFVGGGVPTGSAITTAVVDAAGLAALTSGSLIAGTTYECGALVGSVWRTVRARSTADAHDRGTATGTATLNGTTALASVVATTGAFAIGQRVSGPGIPPGTRLFSGSGASWVMTAAATASGAGVAITADGARAPVVNLGAAATPVTANTTWAARVRQRRAAAGTS